MDQFVLATPPERTPSLLDVTREEKRYRFLLLHTTRAQRYVVHHRREGAPRRPHAHDVYHIVLYTSGFSRFSFRGQREPARRGTLILASPGDSHDFYPQEPGMLVYKEITFALEHPAGPLQESFESLLADYAGGAVPLPESPLQLTPRQSQALALHFDAVLDGLDVGGACPWLASYRALLDVMLWLARELPAGEETPPRGGPAEAPLDRARAILEKQYHRPLTVGELAEQANLSEAHFCRAFGKAFGRPPIAYQRRLRIEAARTLLRTSNLLCKEVARRVGYEDPYFFSRVFRRETGESPRAYRRRAQG